MPDACQSNAVIVIVPVPLPDIPTSAAIPLGTGIGQRPLLLAAPENPYYRPGILFKTISSTHETMIGGASNKHFSR